jgi:hypothetical protein
MDYAPDFVTHLVSGDMPRANAQWKPFFLTNNGSLCFHDKKKKEKKTNTCPAMQCAKIQTFDIMTTVHVETCLCN